MPGETQLSRPRTRVGVGGGILGGALITLFNASATGNQLPYSPHVSLTLGATYTLPTAAGLFVFNANDCYSGRYFVEPDNRISQAPTTS